jgi:hypothetical protein
MSDLLVRHPPYAYPRGFDKVPPGVYRELIPRIKET